MSVKNQVQRLYTYESAVWLVLYNAVHSRVYRGHYPVQYLSLDFHLAKVGRPSQGGGIGYHSTVIANHSFVYPNLVALGRKHEWIY